MNAFYSLESILKQMVCSRKTNPLVYRNFSSLLISDRKESVIEYTMTALIASFLPNSESLPNQSLVFSEPNSLSSFFVNLCREYPWIIEMQLTHEDSQKRYRMALILRSVFALKKTLPAIDVCRQLMTDQLVVIWQTFLKLLTDSEPQIRLVCIQTIEVLLQTQTDEQIVCNLISGLKKRLRDKEPDIRSDSANAVDHCSESENILDHYLMRHLCARAGDCVFEVREKVLISVSNIFHTINRKYGKTRQDFFYKLPTACLLRYRITELEEEKSTIETIFMTNLVDMNAENTTKMRNLLNLICFCDEIGVQSISHIFRNQIKLRTLFLKLIICTERQEYKKSIFNVNPNICENLLKAFEYMDNIENVIKKFHLLLRSYDKKKIEILKNVFDSKTQISCEKSIEAINEFFESEQSVVDSESLLGLKSEIIGRLGIGLIDTNSLIELFGLMSTSDQKFDQRLASFVILLSKCYTNYLTDESVVSELLALPQIIIAWIASDSMLPFMKCTDSLKNRIKSCVEHNYSE